MDAPTQTATSCSLTPSRLANEIIRRYALRGGARVLVIASRPGELVSCLRTRGVMAFGLYDGVVAPRDPYQRVVTEDTPPQTQPVTLHQSLPFPAQSFECIVLQDSRAYSGPLTSPEACTATANLLAALKPARPLVSCGEIAPASLMAHLANFPGAACQIIMGQGGVAALIRRLLGRGGGQLAVQFTTPRDPITRLEWHRIARQAVMSAQRQPAA